MIVYRSPVLIQFGYRDRGLALFLWLGLPWYSYDPPAILSLDDLEPPTTELMEHER